jgi:cellulose synthase/poly-beta-1,6-N-acetylglucosamine synthase-like glycosyltransferase
VTGPDKWRSLHLEQSLGLEPMMNPPYLFGHGSIFKKAALLDVGLYNEKLRTNAEDCYITDKLKAAGYKSIYWPRAVVDHHKRDDFGSIMRTAWRWAFFGYLDDIKLGVALRHVVYKWVKLLPSWLIKDFKAGRVDCAFLSMVAINYSIYKDLEYCMGHLGEKRLFDED